MYYIPYDINLKAFSRKLRNHSTVGEILLWMQLRAGQLRGFTFNRQKSLDNYIVDFYCKPLKLVIEVDAGCHFTPEQRVRDQQRQQILESMGLHFLRFRDEDVRNDLNSVIKAIERYIKTFEAIDND